MQELAISQPSGASVFAYFKYNKDFCCVGFFFFLDFLYNESRNGCEFIIGYTFWVQRAGIKTP